MAETPASNNPEKQAKTDPKAGAGKPLGAAGPTASKGASPGAKPQGTASAASKPKAAEGKPAGAPVSAAPRGKQAPKPTPSVPAPRPETTEETPSRWLHTAFLVVPSWLVSMVVHMVLLLILAIWMVPEPEKNLLSRIQVAPPSKVEELEELHDEPIEQLNVEAPLDTVVVEPDVTKVPEMPSADDMEAAAVKIDLAEFGLEKAPRNDLLARVGTFYGSGLEGRGKGKGQLLAAGGGTKESELAVARALKWLAEHQMPDGGWNFNHTLAPRCKSQCRNPGTDQQARNAATGLALLPFLGAGQTQREGTYKKTVQEGLYFLIGRMQVSPQGGSLYEGGRGKMYSHGIASITLCEAYAMTHDKGLYQAAQQAVNYIAYAQDPVGGGWRYEPRQAGDTSVVGWQVMALKSGHMAYLRIPPITIKKANQYLDSVQSNSGANYGYTEPGAGPATTAIGLLCRMHLGWKKENPALERGVQWLSHQGPSINTGAGSANMYYNYYATQVLRHWEGELWDKWNTKMRESLIQSQAKQGHEEGSWFFTGDSGTEPGGRLYSTAMATMVLEVYYRHMPIYRTQAVDTQFPD